MERDVDVFAEKCADKIAKFERDAFLIGNDGVFCMNKIDSYIEQLLYMALKTLMTINQVEMFSSYLFLKPQFKIDRYRVDFSLDYCPLDREKIKKVLIECDSQQFHERTEKERRYEKARDRYIKMKGYEILHYTGKEIMENPFLVAKEILQYSTGIENIEEDERILED